MARDEFDAEKYVCLEKVGSFESGKGSVEVGIWQYDENPPKVKVQRVGQKKGEEHRRDLGGMTAEECEKLAPLLVKAGKAMRKLEKA